MYMEFAVFYNVIPALGLQDSRILFLFVNMGPSGCENFKTLLLLQIAPKGFQTSLDISPKSHHQTTLGIFKF